VKSVAVAQGETLARLFELACALLALLFGAAVLLIIPFAVHGWSSGAGAAILYDLIFLIPLGGIAIAGWSHTKFGYGLSVLGVSWLALLATAGLWRILLLIPSLSLGATAILAAAFRSSIWNRV